MGVPASRMRSRRARSAALLVAVVIMLSAFAGPAALANLGAGIQGIPVELKSAAWPGTTVNLPPVYIKNTGTEAGQFTLRLEPLEKPKGRKIPTGWVRFVDNSVKLDPNVGRNVAMTLTVPKSARQGTYRAQIVVTTASGQTPNGAAVGAAAGTTLRFAVANEGFHLNLPVPTWILWSLASAAVLLALLWRSGIRLRIER